jgi:hypothetical protein
VITRGIKTFATIVANSSAGEAYDISRRENLSFTNVTPESDYYRKAALINYSHIFASLFSVRSELDSLWFGEIDDQAKNIKGPLRARIEILN